MTQYTDLSIDIETLSTKTKAVVLSIGLVAFNRQGGELGPRLELRPDPQDQLDFGRTVDFATLQWWMQQEMGAQVAAFFRETTPVGEVLIEAREFIRTNLVEMFWVWAKPPTFDIAIIDDLTLRACQDPLWSFRQVRDLVTLKKATRVEDVEPTLAHSAVADAEAQALTCQAAWATITRALESLSLPEE